MGRRRRDLRPDPVRRGGARLDRGTPRDGGTDDHPRRLLEDLRDDRLAAGLRGRADVADPDLRPAHHQHDLVRPDVRPGRRGRGAGRAAGRRRRDGRRVQGPARPRRRRPQRHPGHPLRDAARGVLRLPVDRRDRALRRGARRAPAPRSGRLRAGRDGLRRRRHGAHPDLVRELSREHHARRSAGSGGSWRASAVPDRAERLRRADHPGGGPGGRSAPRARWTSGRTTCRRRGTSCCAASPAATAC